MPVEQFARRSHVVSKFYLRYFADDDEMLTMVELPDRRFAQSVENASVRVDYYTALDPEGHETDVAEKAFGDIEGPAAAAWRLVVDGMWPLRGSDREALAAWIALHLLRTSATRQSMSELGSDLLRLDILLGGRERLRQALREAGRRHDEDAVNRQWIELHRNPPQLQANANHHLLHIADLLLPLTEHLLGRWWVLTTFERKSLGTSDHPVVVVPNARDAERGLGTGMETTDHIALPLTRHMALSLARRDSDPEIATRHDVRQAGTALTALWGNSATSRHARRFLFHHPQDDPFDGLDLPSPRTNELGMSDDPWTWMRPDDRQVLIEAGISPPARTARDDVGFP